MTVLQTPTDLAARGPDLRVALKVDGTWDFDWALSDLGRRIRVESCGTGLNQDYARASLSVDLSGTYDGDDEIAPQLNIGNLYALLNQDTELCVYAFDESLGTDRRFLFHGYGVTDRIRATERDCRFEIICTSMMEWVGRQKGAWILGRYYWDELGDTGVLIESMPCVFNRNDSPNRYKDFIQTSTGLYTPFFTDDCHDHDQADTEYAKFWTYAEAIKYLLNWHFIPDAVNGNPLECSQLISLIDNILSQNRGPQTLVDPGSATLEQVLECKVEPLACEGGHVVDALLRICKATGICLQEWSDAEGNEPKTSLIMHLAGDGGPWATYVESGEDRTLRTSLTAAAPTPRPIRLECRGAAAVGRAPSTFLEANEASKLEIVRDSQNTVNSVRVIGDVPLIEMTLGTTTNGKGGLFVPGWLPDAMFGENLTGGDITTQVAAIAATTSVTQAPSADPEKTLWNRYTAGGLDYNSYRFVGRLWVFNEDGFFTAAAMARTEGPFTAGVYSNPLVLTYVDPDGVRFTLASRRRRILKLVNCDIYGNHFPPIVEASWDSGAHWYPYHGSHKFVADRIGLILTDENLGKVKNKADTAIDSTGGQSVWEAIVRGTFRICVTCGIELDNMVVGSQGGGSHHQDFRVHDSCKVELVDVGNSHGSACVGLTPREIDDTKRVKTLAARALAVGKTKAFGGTVIIPRLSDKWRPGDAVSGLSPVGIRFDTTAGFSRYPQVWRVQWVNSLENQLTHVTIGDARTKARPSAT